MSWENTVMQEVTVTTLNWEKQKVFKEEISDTEESYVVDFDCNETRVMKVKGKKNESKLFISLKSNVNAAPTVTASGGLPQEAVRKDVTEEKCVTVLDISEEPPLNKNKLPNENEIVDFDCDETRFMKEQTRTGSEQNLIDSQMYEIYPWNEDGVSSIELTQGDVLSTDPLQETGRDCLISSPQATNRGRVVTIKSTKFHTPDRANKNGRSRKEKQKKYLVDCEYDEKTNKYICKTCEKSYKTKRSLMTHKRLVCNVAPRFKCMYCDYRGRNKTDIHQHLGRRHDRWPRLNDEGVWVC